MPGSTMLKSISTLTEHLQGSCLFENVPLKELTSFRIGGPAALVYRPESPEGLLRAIEKANELGCPYHVMGNGTNILAPDEGYPGLIIRMDKADKPPLILKNEVTVSAGERLGDVARLSLSAGLMGLEALAGIPGTVGGAIAMNAGAYGSEISDYLKSVTILKAGKIIEAEVSSSDFGPRKSAYCAPDIILLSARFVLPYDDGTAKARMEDCKRQRMEKQPLSYPSAGSVFKRPAGHYAGALIEQCSLKGCRAGDAEVSMQHAGFIINTGHATEKDVLELIAHIQDRVRRVTGISLEREIRRLCEI